jgi:hypothetical protein
MTKLDEIQEYRMYLQRARDASEILFVRYWKNKNIINLINIFLLKRIMKKFEKDIEKEINKIRERKD